MHQGPFGWHLDAVVHRGIFGFRGCVVSIASALRDDTLNVPHHGIHGIAQLVDFGLDVASCCRLSLDRSLKTRFPQVLRTPFYVGWWPILQLPKADPLGPQPTQSRPTAGHVPLTEGKASRGRCAAGGRASANR
jgi:hypothetical protein